MLTAVCSPGRNVSRTGTSGIESGTGARRDLVLGAENRRYRPGRDVACRLSTTAEELNINLLKYIYLK